MREYIRKKFSLTEEEKESVRKGQNAFQTNTWAEAQIFFIDECERLKNEGKKLDYSLEKGEIKTRIWFDKEYFNFKVQFCFEQVELNMQEIEKEMVADIENWWLQKHAKKK